jgi:hypothetical protein
MVFVNEVAATISAGERRVGPLVMAESSAFGFHDWHAVDDHAIAVGEPSAAWNHPHREDLQVHPGR